ncbi:hypothetical protein [Frigoriglobus tundricola]|uniref:Uncharacterized protein n=1 Tax=Frigoriglobus tundricola TaxID=2774151 RepID=A0A6M5YH52_9BACT|nr:hypothetical protein [Frigoriglobus tundricola]QJW92596.1 hypothetical protein FTUN_0093 [Frigoriglobus tundricola]
MTRVRLGHFILATFVASLLAAAGCSPPPKGTPVSGTVTLPKGASFDKDDNVEITFRPDGDAKSAVGSVITTEKSSSVTFTAKTAGITTGVLPGKYRIGVKITPYAGMPGNKDRKRGFDEGLNQKYKVEKSPLTCEVTADAPNDFTIDLEKGNVKKN